MMLTGQIRNFAPGAISSLLLLAFIGCKCGERTTVQSEPIPSDLTIFFGQEGTFAGRAMGYSIDGDGRVTRWEGRFPGENEQATATIDVDEVRRLWNRIEEIDFLEMREQAMTTQGMFITVSADGESRRVTWVPGRDGAKTAVQEFYDECIDVARTALGESGGSE